MFDVLKPITDVLLTWRDHPEISLTLLVCIAAQCIGLMLAVHIFAQVIVTSIRALIATKSCKPVGHN